MKNGLIQALKIFISFYVLGCVLLYFFQEKILFHPSRLDKNHIFKFSNKFEEYSIKTKDGITLHGLLFKADSSSKGLIFYLHGNAGSLDNWGEVAKTYTDLHYDVFMLDYRGYGKSEGAIEGQEQVFEDNQLVYNELKKKYNENKIIVLGYSIGTGMAANLAATNQPKLLILQAPYYSLTDMMEQTVPIVPTFILRYKFATNEFVKSCKMPVIIFHGNQDEVIYYGSSLKLKEEFKKQDSLITLDRQGHNGITDNEHYKKEIKRILAD